MVLINTHRPITGELGEIPLRPPFSEPLNQGAFSFANIDFIISLLYYTINQSSYQINQVIIRRQKCLRQFRQFKEALFLTGRSLPEEL